MNERVREFLVYLSEFPIESSRYYPLKVGSLDPAIVEQDKEEFESRAVLYRLNIGPVKYLS